MAEIRVPTLGESVTEATIGKWFKKPATRSRVDEPLVELETDKVTIEVPAPAAGVLGEIAAKDGETVAVGALLGQIKEGAGAAPAGRARPEDRAAPKPIDAGPSSPRRAAAARPPGAEPRRRSGGAAPMRRSRRRCASSRPKAASTRRPSPAPARTAASPRATCWRPSSAPPRSRRRSPQPAAAVQARAPSPADDAAREERVRMTRLRQTIARRLKDAQNTAAMLTTFNEVDMSRGHGAARAIPRPVREEARRQARLHGLLRARLRAGAQGNPRRQCRDRRRRPHLQELLSHRHRGRHRTRPRGAGGARLPTRSRSPRSRRRSPISAAAPATARSRSRRCRAAPSPSPTAASTAR